MSLRYFFYKNTSFLKSAIPGKKRIFLLEHYVMQKSHGEDRTFSADHNYCLVSDMTKSTDRRTYKRTDGEDIPANISHYAFPAQNS
jgi:hypothetical protein